MGKINVLEKSVAEKIAAGEVVERPASVVKELVENSIDANASSVTVEIEKGGTLYIRVTDNGSGIEKDDVATAFLRHATSKIKDAGDLSKIATLGFRGEALCSISAVSKTTLITRTRNESMGTMMEVEGGETKAFSDAGCPPGTTVTVKNLFFNTPARMKFLKKDQTEAAYVTDICQRAALSHPEVSFRYIRDGRDIFFTPGDNVLKNAVRAVFGKDISGSTLEISGNDGIYGITGLTGANSLSRPNRNMQFFFVNGRLVKSRILSLAADEGYKNELMAGRFPVCFINIEMPADYVDVNVHPAKTEVKFSDDEAVYRAVAFTVRAALAKAAGPRAVFREDKAAFKMPTEQRTVTQATFRRLEKSGTSDAASLEKAIKAAKKEKTALDSERTEPKTSAFKKLERSGRTASSPDELPKKPVEGLSVSEEAAAPEEAFSSAPIEEKSEQPSPAADEPSAPDFSLVGQLFSTYIILQTENEMIMVDQHAAHERINYERIRNGESMKQLLLSPITVSLPPREKSAWEENAEFFKDAGFDVSDFGQNSVIIRSLPSDIDFEDGEALFIEMLSSLMGEGRGGVSEARDWALYSVACKASIKAKTSLSDEEMIRLCRDALALEGISTCPHGRPISIKMTKYQIEKMFKRIV